MESVNLEPGEYDGTYKLVGNRLSLDLVNTVSWPGSEREHDWLSPAANLGLWSEATGLGLWDVTDGDAATARTIRGVVSDVLRPLARDEQPDKRSIETFNALLKQTMSRRTIDPVSLAWSWQDRPTNRLDPVILDAADVLTRGDHDRLRECPSCLWMFEDQTRNGKRRWCDMTDCGSRAKARAYYHRHKTLHQGE